MKSASFFSFFIVTFIIVLGLQKAVASEVGSCETGSPRQVRVATLNLMTTNVPYSFLFGSWESRSNSIAAWAQEQQIDILGTQEGTESMLSSLSQKTPHLKKIFRSRLSPNNNTEYTTLFFNPKKFALLSDGEFWMSKTPDVPESRNWGSSAARRTVWAQLQNKQTGNSIFVFNAHFDFLSEKARVESAKLALEKIKAIAGQSQVVLMGDLNVTASEETMSVLEQELLDTRSSSLHPPVGSLSTYIIMDRRLDYIYTDRGTKTCQYQVQKPKTKKGTWVSDHLPVIADIEN
ncbi:endonuclease/exonuclease/phosphatase family protein [Bdellovibrio bacteriovorus]